MLFDRNTDVDILRRQLEDLQAANARLQGERDQFRNAYTQLRLEQAPTRHEQHQSQSNQLQPQEQERIQSVDFTENDMAIDSLIPESRPCSALRETSGSLDSSTLVVKTEPPSPLSSLSAPDTPPATMIPPCCPKATPTDDIKPTIQKRNLVPHVEITTRPSPGYIRDVSDGDILRVGSRQSLRRKAAANHRYIKHETPAPELNEPKTKLEQNVDEDRKPKKKDEQAIIIPPDFIESLLRGVPALTVPNLQCKVRRDFLTTTYGCASQGFYGYIAPNRNPTGVAGGERRMLAFPSPKYNQAVPTAPGRPGLIFSVQHRMLDHTASLFVKEDTAVPVWKYYGEYKSCICGTMDKKLWTMQSTSLRTSWAGKILKQRVSCYSSMHARIKLRKAGRAVTDDAVFALMETKKAHHGLTVPDVLDALDKGEESLDIIRMECVGYDEPFIHHVYARSRHWDPDDPFSGALTDDDSSSEEDDSMSDDDS